MPYIEPNSDLMLFKDVPFDPTHENTMYFASYTEQNDYFTSKPYLSFSHLSYSRRGRGYIRLQVPISTVYEYSYMRYKNTEFENKWFYAFITKIEYVNNITTDIFFEIDMIQTWFYYPPTVENPTGRRCYSFNQCFIERQHVAIANHAYDQIPENFEVGDYVANDPDVQKIFPLTPVIVLATTVTLDDSGGQQMLDDVRGQIYSGRNQNGVYYSGVEYYLFDPTVQAEVDNLNDILVYLTNNNKIDSVISIFMASKEIFTRTTLADIVRSRGTTLDGYTVKNEKLLRYPYNLLQVTNLMGEKADLRFEFGTNGTITLKRFGNVTTRPAMITYPINYRRIAEDFENMVTSEAFPLCSYNNDTYKAWLAQNQGTLIATGVGTAIGLIGGIATANGSAIMAGATQIAGLIGKCWDKSTLPPTNHGNSNGDIVYQAGLSGVAVYRLSIQNHIAEEYDNFLDMYGYTINKVGTPQLDIRPCWTYVKTRDCNIEGSLPADDKKIIEDIFNKGIRFWKTSAVFGSFNPSDNNNYYEAGGN